MKHGAQELAESGIRAMYAEDRVSQALGMQVAEVHPGAARVTMVVRADMVNGHHVCHGGVIFALADSAFAFACNSYGAMTVAAGATIDFLRPVRIGDHLVAVAVERSQGRRTGVYDVTVQNQAGETVALFRGRSHRSAA
ncbi:MAG: hydroxyphenylacetyl-CoA thioesterase PaaI [Steroidobacteraceae bacterium]